MKTEHGLVGKTPYFMGILFACMVFISCNNDEISYEPKASGFIEQQEVPRIRFIGQWLNEGKRGDLVRDFTRQYEFMNQHIIVDLKFPEELFEDYADRKSNARVVSEQIAKSKPDFDIIRLNNQYLQISALCNDSLWAKKNLVDFSEIPEFRSNTLPSLLTEKVKQSWGGIIPGPFLEGSYWALWSNNELAKKLGISIKSKGMTVDDFIGYIQAVNEYNTKNPSNYIVPIHEAYDWQTLFALFFHMYASELNNNDELFGLQVTENKLLAWHKTLIAIEELSKYKPLDPYWQNVTWEQSTGDLLSEQCLFYINGSWMYNIWESNNSAKTMNVYPNEFPVFNSYNMYPSAYFITWGVLKKSPNRDEAVKLLLAMNKPDVAEMWVQYTKCPTGIKGKLTDLSFGGDQFEIFSNHVQKYYGSNTYNWEEEICFYVNGDKESKHLFYREVLAGIMSADEAMSLIRSNLPAL